MSGLGRVDRGLAILSWVAAAAFGLMLIFGPVLVASDKPGATTTYGKGGSSGSSDGKALFSDNCGSCHTLSAAGTSGTVGPSLDGANLSSDEVSSIMSEGPGVMPSFSGSLSPAQIKSIAKFVADSSGS